VTGKISARMCAHRRGDVSGMRENSSAMNTTQHTGVSSGLHDILAIIGIKLRFMKKSTPYYLTNSSE
jgi:hypothetical protein